MIEIERFEEILNELAEELPVEFFKHLNGGILVLPEAKDSEHTSELCVMGEYITSPSMGRYIKIYYGSFARVYGELEEVELKSKMRGVLRHEFRHHMERLGGTDELGKEDQRFINSFLRQRNKNA